MTNGRTDGQTDGQTNGRTDGPTDGRTDQRTDGRTDKASYRVASLRLKIKNNWCDIHMWSVAIISILSKAKKDIDTIFMIEQTGQRWRFEKWFALTCPTWFRKKKLDSLTMVKNRLHAYSLSINCKLLILSHQIDEYLKEFKEPIFLNAEWSKSSRLTTWHLLFYILSC